MDHQEALAAQAVERYLLNDLGSSLKESFEEHFFDCPDCAAALREHEVFMANAKVVLRETPAAPPLPAMPKPGLLEAFRPWLRWPVLVPAMAAILIAFILIRNFNGGSQPVSEAVTAADIVFHHNLNPQVRGAASDVDRFSIPAGATKVQFDIDMLPGSDPSVHRWAKYHWEVKDASGHVLAASDGSATKDQAQLLLPPIAVSNLVPGKHQLFVHPLDGSKDELISTFLIEPPYRGK
jgi:hypothetical protein